MLSVVAPILNSALAQGFISPGRASIAAAQLSTIPQSNKFPLSHALALLQAIATEQADVDEARVLEFLCLAFLDKPPSYESELIVGRTLVNPISPACIGYGEVFDDPPERRQPELVAATGTLQPETKNLLETLVQEREIVMCVPDYRADVLVVASLSEATWTFTSTIAIALVSRLRFGRPSVVQESAWVNSRTRK